MKRFIAAAFAVALAAGPVAALADSFKVGNFTGSNLHFGIRCDDGADTWHLYTIGAMAQQLVGGSLWNYRCSDETYKLRIGTIASDGSTSYHTLTLRSGNNYALVLSSQQDGYYAYDTRWFVAVRNQTAVTVNLGYSCVDGPAAQGTEAIAPTSSSSPPSWFYSKGCSTFNVKTNAVQRDGTHRIWSRDIASNANYRLTWNANTGKYVLTQY
ncbi:MAG TPA: hypothetical protein VK760_02530 [Candidatus Acidoferrales bacterium]|jgi:hypothetical protein|nr:hypothetical protein [Candidatus Acidoferrales bacterium]